MSLKKKLKKVGKKLKKSLGKIAPILPFVPGVGVVAGTLAAAAGKLGSKVSKAGKYATGIAASVNMAPAPVESGFASQGAAFLPASPGDFAGTGVALPPSISADTGSPGASSGGMQKALPFLILGGGLILLAMMGRKSRS